MIGGKSVSFVVVFLTHVVTTLLLAPPAAAGRGYERGHPAPRKGTSSPALL
jgi:hypothetical protein